MKMHSTRVIYAEVDGPTGPLLLTSDGSALTGLYHRGQKWGREPDDSWLLDDAPPLKAAAGQLAAYFAGESGRFDVPVSLGGTAFQRLVWDELRAIPFGETVSYGELARRVGSPKAGAGGGGAPMGVGGGGGAVGRNPASIVVPCHRVIGSGGRLTGYAGGLDRKGWLLEHERGARARLLRVVEIP